MMELMTKQYMFRPLNANFYDLIFFILINLCPVYLFAVLSLISTQGGDQ